MSEIFTFKNHIFKNDGLGVNITQFHQRKVPCGFNCCDKQKISDLKKTWFIPTSKTFRNHHVYSDVILTQSLLYFLPDKVSSELQNFIKNEGSEQNSIFIFHDLICQNIPFNKMQTEEDRFSEIIKFYRNHRPDFHFSLDPFPDPEIPTTFSYPKHKETESFGTFYCNYYTTGYIKAQGLKYNVIGLESVNRAIWGDTVFFEEIEHDGSTLEYDGLNGYNGWLIYSNEKKHLINDGHSEEQCQNGNITDKKSHHKKSTCQIDSGNCETLDTKKDLQSFQESNNQESSLLQEDLKQNAHMSDIFKDKILKLSESKSERYARITGIKNRRFQAMVANEIDISRTFSGIKKESSLNTNLILVKPLGNKFPPLIVSKEEYNKNEINKFVISEWPDFSKYPIGKKVPLNYKGEINSISDRNLGAGRQQDKNIARDSINIDQNSSQSKYSDISNISYKQILNKAITSLLEMYSINKSSNTDIDLSIRNEHERINWNEIQLLHHEKLKRAGIHIDEEASDNFTVDSLKQRLKLINPHRLDLTHLQIISIDPPGCTDIDDCLSIEVLGPKNQRNDTSRATKGHETPLSQQQKEKNKDMKRESSENLYNRENVLLFNQNYTSKSLKTISPKEMDDSTIFQHEANKDEKNGKIKCIKSSPVELFDDSPLDKPADKVSLNSQMFRIGVHIADVSSFIPTKSSCNHEAAQRSTTVYLNNRRIDMIPEIFSSDLCSLRNNELRFAISVLIDIEVTKKQNNQCKKNEFSSELYHKSEIHDEYTSSTKIHNIAISESLINSYASYTYQEAEDILSDSNHLLYSDFNHLHTLSKILKSERVRNGAINIHSSEIRVSAEGRIDFKKTFRSNSLIEEMMILANNVVGKFIKQNSTKWLLRKHDQADSHSETTNMMNQNMDEAQNNSLKSNLSNIQPTKNDKSHLSVEHTGLTEKFGHDNSKSTLDYNEKSQSTPLGNALMVRSMKKALYTTKFPVYHTGLALPVYTHFTSPIRRYPDLLVHRIIKSIIYKQEYELEIYTHHMNKKSRNSQIVSRECNEHFIYWYLVDQNGNVRIKSKNTNEETNALNHKMSKLNESSGKDDKSQKGAIKKSHKTKAIHQKIKRSHPNDDFPTYTAYKIRTVRSDTGYFTFIFLEQLDIDAIIHGSIDSAKITVRFKRDDYWWNVMGWMIFEQIAQ